MCRHLGGSVMAHYIYHLQSLALV